MEGTTEKDCSPLWSLYQQVVTDMKNSTPMWEEFISKATKLHSALKSALSAIAAFLDAFQKIADAATNARGATKEIGTALTRVCLRHRAIETRMKTFIGVLMDTLINPLSERTEEWRRGCGTGALSREHARECKRARAELRRRVHDAQRNVRKARRAPPDAKRRADVSIQDVQERKSQLEDMEEKAVKAALIEERSRFCHFVSLLNPVVECEVAMLAEVGHLQEGSEQLMRHTAEPRTLPPGSLQVICDVKACSGAWSEPGSAPHSPSSSRLGSRKSSLTSLCSVNTNAVSSSTVSCSTPLSNASSDGTLPQSGHENQHLSLSQARLPSASSSDSGFRSQDALHRQLQLFIDNASDAHSVSSECTTPAANDITDHSDSSHDQTANAASATWPDLKDTAQFERAASAIMSGRPHTISAAYSGGHPRAALSVHTFSSQNEISQAHAHAAAPAHTHAHSPRDNTIYARPPLPTRCSSLERPIVPAKTNANTPQQDFKTAKPSSLPPHLTKDIPQAVYVNMSELASLAAATARQLPHDAPAGGEKVCSESSASESSLESSSGYGSQGAFANEEHAHNIQISHPEPLHEAFCYNETIECQIVTLRRPAASPPEERRSLQTLPTQEEQISENGVQTSFATVVKPATRPRPLSLTATVWSRRGSSSSLGKPPPPVRRSSSISRTRPGFGQGAPQSPAVSSEADHLPPPPAFLLQPENDRDAIAIHQNSVAETIKQLTELKHMPASPSAARRAAQLAAQHARLAAHNDTYGHAGGHRMMYDQNSIYARKSSLNASLSELRSADDSPLSSFGPRDVERSHYGHTGFKLQQEKQYGGIYASPSQLIDSETRSQTLAERRPSGLIASLSAKLAPQLSPRTSRRAISTIAPAVEPQKSKPQVPLAAAPGFLDKLSASLQQQRRQQQLQLDSTRASAVRHIINTHAQPDPRACHTSLMEQIKRGATLKRNKQCNDRSAPKIR